MKVPTERLRLCSLLVLFLVLCPLANAVSNPRIVPLRTSATFSSNTPNRHWSAPIKTTDGSTAYVLSLEPDFDIQNHALTLELVLRRSGENADAPNLIAPNRRWHGLQQWTFNANDLAQGPKKSGYGKTRTMSLKGLGLMVNVDISNAAVSPISASSYQLDTISLQIVIDNWR